MTAKRKKRERAATFSLGRIIGGIFVLYLSFSGAKGLYTMDRSHPIAIVILLIGAPICILFFLLGFAMITVGMSEKKKRRKVSPDKLK